MLSLFFMALAAGVADANVILKFFTVNPSKEQTQKVSLRATLPKEVKLEDIIDRDDLDIVYDTQQGCYVAFGEYELKPGETLEKKMEVRNIWLIPNSEIEAVRADLKKLFNLLKNTEFSDRLVFLTNSIELKLNQVIERQKDSPTDPEQLFSNYRENLKIMESIKADLAWGHSFLSELRPFPAANVLWIIVFIIISLGLLGASFYAIWKKQIKSIAQYHSFPSINNEDSVEKNKPIPDEKKEDLGKLE
jgi:hypothetical protein